LNKGPPKRIGAMLVLVLLAVAALFVGLLSSSSSGTQASASTSPVMIDTAALASADSTALLSAEANSAVFSTTLINDVALIDTSTASEVLANESGSSSSGANFIAASVDEISASTGIGDRFIGATASVLGTEMVLGGVLPLTTATLAAIAVTTLALWYLFRRTRDGPSDDNTILDVIYVALRSGMRSALGRVAKNPLLGTGTFVRGHSPLLA